MSSNSTSALPPEASSELTAVVPASVAGDRLDAVVARLFDDYSRSRLQTWIAAGHLTVDGQQRRGRDRLVGGEQISLKLPPDAVAQSWQESWDDGAAAITAEAMNIELVHSDQAIHIVNKTAGLVMHPAPGHRHGTLMNGLLHQDPSLVNVPRAGIVHRLDKDTTGLCVIARTLKAHTHLVRQLQERSMGREYLAIVLGDVLPGGSVREPIGRHPRDRKRMAVVPGGKMAITHYRVVERLPGCALVAVNLETGRTHQIRVHMAHLGLPILGDPVYGRRVQTNRLPFTIGPEVVEFSRQALHAQKLTLLHPDTGETCVYTAELPGDMQGLLERLRDSVVFV
jgi:23S rRNA pseudouridine1911/1915/1917 synthase